ncbi:DUF4365 domain-containing protein [Vibrio coralliilyticus]|uniref:DUF4365 domain-containing protein n=1 Tax=Vibrio coralliilyticus TaxID=190893 RepID=UPI00148CF6E5|nr:DUF4365 domain-containing protein [Vibrio coralliilyticus]NOH53643.1 DUF4365 domain-containing protein [Vibrio coralliilyticus]
MNAGEIGAAAGRIFGYKLPLNWIIRSQEDQDDHGIDCEIELKDQNGKALGQESVFKIQLKGQENCSFISDNQKLSFSVPRERLEYYLQFNIPVILVVVEVSSEDIYWVSVTDNEEIRSNLKTSSANSLTVHLPVANILERNDSATFDALLKSVESCWDFLSLRDLKVAVSNCSTLKPEAINKCIEQVGDALFKAYHIKLDQLFCDRLFHELFQQASDIIKSPVFPAKDRFLATLYFDKAFDIQPYTQVKNEQIAEKLKLCEHLVHLAREQRESVYRLTAIAKVRSSLLHIKIEQLYALHHTNENFKTSSFEYLYMNGQAHKQYHDICVLFQKLINMCHRLIAQSQFSILADLMCDIALSMGLFKTIHNARGTDEAITFLDEWFMKMMLTVLTYVSLVKDLGKIEQLYLYINFQRELRKIIQFDLRDVILEHCPSAQDLLDEIDQVMANKGESKSFAESSVEEQKQFFSGLAKNLGIDPDNPNCELGQIVARGLKNYDPTDVLGHCQNMFVDYRPGGIVAEQLRMHSAAGMHLLVCLKHNHAIGTGNLLITTFDNPHGPEFARGFKQQYCDKCSDCVPRDDEWCWSLKWHYKERDKHRDILSIFKF